MSKRRHKFEVTDAVALKAAFPNAVTEEHIPARVEYKPVYSVISALLSAGVVPPGVTVENPTAAAEPSIDELHAQVKQAAEPKPAAGKKLFGHKPSDDEAALLAQG